MRVVCVNWLGLQESGATSPEIMRRLDCFVLPSRAEGISNTILEAMSSALPVIATHVGGNSELIEADMTGKLVPAGDPRALAEGILGYFANPALARRHGRAGRHRVERSFSLERMVDSYHSLYLAELVRTASQHARCSVCLRRKAENHVRHRCHYRHP